MKKKESSVRSVFEKRRYRDWYRAALCLAKNVSINLGKADAMLTENEQVKGEVFKLQNVSNSIS